MDQCLRPPTSKIVFSLKPEHDFQKTISENPLVLVDFWAPWCGPCRAVAPVLEEISTETNKILITKMNTDENQQTAAAHGIMSLPTMLIFKNGELVDQMVGAQSKAQIISKIDSHF